MKKLRPLLLPCAVIVPLAFLWFVLINHLRVEWTLNPQYGYGWAVPFLCVYLVWRNFQNAQPETRTAECKTLPSGILGLLLAGFAILYAPTRLIQEANPDWRLISWLLAVEVIGITLCVLGLALRYFPRSTLRLSTFLFPVCFFLVAVPWPSALEQSVIQGLTRADAGATTELLGWLGVAALQHGNVIEVATGNVGIDEACSGIRSFQATLMISLFLGELYRLKVAPRLILVLAGFAMSFLFNLARMSLLVWVAAHQGIQAIATWHDPAGVTILLACFLGLWGAGEWLKHRQQKLAGRETKSGGEKQTLKNEILKAENRLTTTASSSAPAVALAVWLLAVELCVGWWYRSHEAHLPAGQQWTAVWPTNQPAFTVLTIPARARQILRYDEGRSAAWQQDEFQWQAIFLRWNPGSAAQHLAQNHTPEICLSAAGHTLVPVAGLQWLEVNGLHLAYRLYQITDERHSFFVFYSLWNDHASEQGFETANLTWGSRLAPVRAGLRNPGQRSLEMALSGNLDAAQAKAAFQEELRQIIQNETGRSRPGK